MTERAEFQVFDPSTFTHIGRNERAVAELLQARVMDGLPRIREVILLGSGVVEPFTIASLPWMRDAFIHAVDVNEYVVGIGQSIQKGEAIPWDVVGLISKNPDRPNSDFSEQERIRRGLIVLDEMGCLENLGEGFTDRQMQVAPDVRERVNFVHGKALEALNGQLAQIKPDFIGAFFMLLNINKDPDPEKGLNYSRAVIDRALNMLDSEGILMIGDTSLNLPKTFNQVVQSTKGRLNLAGMVHMVNFGRGVTSSHYVVASQMEPYPGNSDWLATSRMRILSKNGFEKIEVQETSAQPEEMVERSEKRLNIGFVGPWREDGKGTSWDSGIAGVAEAIKKFVPNPNDEASEDTVFSAQKPHLKRLR